MRGKWIYNSFLKSPYFKRKRVLAGQSYNPLLVIRKMDYRKSS